jgi:hypothetical protein
VPSPRHPRFGVAIGCLGWRRSVRQTMPIPFSHLRLTWRHLTALVVEETLGRRAGESGATIPNSGYTDPVSESGDVASPSRTMPSQPGLLVAADYTLLRSVPAARTGNTPQQPLERLRLA